MPKWNTWTERCLSELTNRLKKKRVELFVEALGLGPGDSVLDLGSEDGSYLATYYPHPENIVLADVQEEPMARGVAEYGLNGYILLDPEGPLPIADRQFDAVWCNSVIEHVTVRRDKLASMPHRKFLARARKRQTRFAREVRRVARKYFVQTPYLHFPIEAHAWLPGIQYCSLGTHWRISQMLKKIWIKQWEPDFLLYSIRRFKQDFPDATGFCVERALGLPKSLIALRAETAQVVTSNVKRAR